MFNVCLITLHTSLNTIFLWKCINISPYILCDYYCSSGHFLQSFVRKLYEDPTAIKAIPNENNYTCKLFFANPVECDSHLVLLYHSSMLCRVHTALDSLILDSKFHTFKFFSPHYNIHSYLN